jgi:putative tryptophan/tyrosine transport system substrate-binding protein
MRVFSAIGNGMKRRDFIGLIGIAAASPIARPLVARAQQPAMPVVGFMHIAAPAYFTHLAPAFSLGLKESGYVEGRNVTVEYHYAEGHYEQLPALAADLVARRVAVIVAAGGTGPAAAAKAATATIPIVFVSAADPLKTGLVASLNRPGGNVTGVSLIGSVLEAKKLELLHQATPRVSTIAALFNPDYPDVHLQLDELQTAAARLGVGLVALNADSAGAIEVAFATLVQRGAGALLVAEDPLFAGLRDQIVASAGRYAIPAIYFQKEFVVEGGLISYGPHFADGYRRAGVYVGRILKGERPADLPVEQPTRFEMVINLKTAKALGLDVPPTLLALADEVIE